MAYDSESDVIIMFGGYSNKGYFGDTWIYNLTDDRWTEKTPVTSPGARRQHGMAYDSESDVIIMFGGYGSGNPLQDTWIYNLTSNIWTQKVPGTSPSARYHHAMIYDSENDLVVLFSGYGTSYSQDTWVYNLTDNNWTDKSPSLQPGAREGHALVYDSNHKVSILFGGGPGYYQDTWVYSLSNQTRIKYQVRACNQADCSGSEFVGPGNSTSSYFTEVNKLVDISFIPANTMYFQYKALLSTSSQAYTPYLQSTIVYYNGTYTNSSADYYFTFNASSYGLFPIVVNTTYDAIFGNQSRTLYVGSPPTVPRLYMPLNNSLIATRTPTLEIANSSDLEGESIVYGVEIATSPGFSTLAYVNNSVSETQNTTKAYVPDGYLLDGMYYWRVNASDAVFWSTYSATYNFTIDTILPNLAMASPLNTTYRTNNLALNITSTSQDIDKHWYSLNNGQTNTSFTPNITLTGLPEGTSLLIVWVNDSANNVNKTNVTFFVDSILPSLNITYPENRSYTYAISSLNYTIADTNLAYCSYSLDNGQTNTTITCGQNVTGLNSGEGSNRWEVYANDSVGNLAKANITFFIDSAEPSVYIAYPQNRTYSQIIDALNYTIIDEDLAYCWYSLDNGQTNTTITCGQNVTGLDSGEGSSRWYLYANDTLGNTNSSNVTFFVDTIKPLIEFNAQTMENNTNTTYNQGLYANVSVTELNEVNTTFTLVNASHTVNRTTFTSQVREFNHTGLLNDGIYWYNVTVCDTASNCNSTGTRKLTIDTTTPGISYGVRTENNATNFSRSWIYVNVSVTEINEANVTFLLYNSTKQIYNITNASGIRDINFTNLNDGTYYYNVTVTDAVNNKNTTETRTITLDNTNPLIAYGARTENNATNFSRSWIYINVSVTEINEANVTFLLHNSTKQIYNITNASGIRDINFTNLSDGTYYYNVTVTDAVNKKNTTETRMIRLDTTSPSIQITQPSGAKTERAITAQFNIFENTKISYCYYNVTISGITEINNTEITNCLQNSSLLFTVGSDGAFIFNLWANDSTGNSVQTSLSFTVDTSVPTTPIGGGAGGEAAGGAGGDKIGIMLEIAKEEAELKEPMLKEVINGVKVFLLEFKEILVQNETVTVQLLFINTENSEKRAVLELQGNITKIMSLDKDSLFLGPYEQEFVLLLINTLEVAPSVYTGVIKVNVNGKTTEIPATIKLTTKARIEKPAGPLEFEIRPEANLTEFSKVFIEQVLPGYLTKIPERLTKLWGYIYGIKYQIIFLIAIVGLIFMGKAHVKRINEKTREEIAYIIEHLLNARHSLWLIHRLLHRRFPQGIIEEEFLKAYKENKKEALGLWIRRALEEGLAEEEIVRELKRANWSKKDYSELLNQEKKKYNQRILDVVDKEADEIEINVKRYMEELLKRGYSEEQIKELFISRGWDKDTIELLVSELKAKKEIPMKIELDKEIIELTRNALDEGLTGEEIKQGLIKLKVPEEDLKELTKKIEFLVWKKSSLR